MIRKQTVLKRLKVLDEFLHDTVMGNPDLLSAFPRNCEVQYLSMGDGLRVLASGMYVDAATGLLTPGEALEFFSGRPDLVHCRELLDPRKDTIRHVLIWPDGEYDEIVVKDEDSAFELFSYMRGASL